MSQGDKKVKAAVLAGFGINCDEETCYALERAGAVARRLHINRLIQEEEQGQGLSRYQILVVDGGFAWADDHGAGVLLAMKLKSYLSRQIQAFIDDGKLIIGICNGFQALVNMGLLPGFDHDYNSRSVALAANECANYRDDWVHLKVDPESKCVFTQGITNIDLPVRHGEGKFYAPDHIITRLKESGQVVMRYAKPATDKPRRGTPHHYEVPDTIPADGTFPFNPNGSLDDIAGICDPTGRVFGLMPHPEGFHHLTNHPDWTRLVDHKKRWNFTLADWQGQGIKIFKNAVEYIEQNLF